MLLPCVDFGPSGLRNCSNQNHSALSYGGNISVSLLRTIIQRWYFWRFDASFNRLAYPKLGYLWIYFDLVKKSGWLSSILYRSWDNFRVWTYLSQSWGISQCSGGWWACVRAAPGTLVKKENILVCDWVHRTSSVRFGDQRDDRWNYYGSDVSKAINQSLDQASISPIGMVSFGSSILAVGHHEFQFVCLLKR